MRKSKRIFVYCSVLCDPFYVYIILYLYNSMFCVFDFEDGETVLTPLYIFSLVFYWTLQYYFGLLVCWSTGLLVC